MKVREMIKEYRDIFLANIYDGKRQQENMNGIQSALVLLAVFSFVMSLRYALLREWDMLVSGIVLGVLFLATFFVGRRTGRRAAPLVFCMVGVTVVFTYYLFSGGDDGFSALWIMLAPMSIMATVGIKAGAVVGVYFQLILFIFFWTPLKSTVAMHYSETFLKHFPLLYLCTLLICFAVMLSHKKQQMALDRYQDDLEKAVKAEHEKVTQITFQTIATISSIVDAKDTYTDDHSIRVANYACLIAAELGFTPQEITNLYHAALLHDIGKIGIQDSILKKSDRLSANEYEIMKTHTSIGAFILKELTFLDRADEGALYHHERYDGSGYPFGLKGEDIPINARIICVADSFDAMNTNRAYRGRCGENYILDELKSGSGKQFDPLIVDALLRCIEKNVIPLP